VKKPAAPAGHQFQRPTKLNFGEVKLRESLKKAGQVLTPTAPALRRTA